MASKKKQSTEKKATKVTPKVTPKVTQSVGAKTTQSLGRLPQGFRALESWEPSRLKEILKGFKQRRILVVGDVGIDRYTLGSVDRISPEAPVPIVLVQSEQHKLGLAANVADNLRTLTAQPMLVGLVGKDRGAQDFKALLRTARIDSKYLLTDASRRTVLKERVVSDRQQLLRVDYETTGALSKKIERDLIARIEKLIPMCDAIILQDYAKGLLTENLCKRVFAAADRAGKWVAVDPNQKAKLDLYRGGFVLTPNTKEAEALAGLKIVDLPSLREAAQRILATTGAEHVVITRGKDGMAILSKRSSEVRLIPTYVREVYDVSGAGDTVISALTLALVAGASIEHACILGNLAAGVEVGKRGTATVSGAEILEAMEFFG